MKAVESLEFCLQESSVTTMAGGSVHSLPGVRNSQLSGVSAAAGAQEAPAAGTPSCLLGREDWRN